MYYIIQIDKPDSEIQLAILPSKFRKLIWIKRGDYLIVNKSEADIEIATGEKGKVMFNICNILQPNQIKDLKSEGKWPEYFNQDKGKEKEVNKDDDNIVEDDLLMDNPNRIACDDYSSDEEDEETE